MRINNNNQSGPLYAGFTRLQNFPLDSDSVKANIAELKEYLKSNGNVYNGQIISVLSDVDGKPQTYIITDRTSTNFETAAVKITNENDILEIKSEFNNTIENKIKDVNDAIDFINNDLDSFKESNAQTIQDLKKTVEKNKTELKNDLSAISALVGENSKLIEANKKAIEDNKRELQNNIDAFSTNLSNHIEKYNEKVRELNDLILENTKKINSNTTKIAENTGTLNSLTTTTTQLSNKINAIETWENETKVKLETVATKEELKAEIQKAVETVDLNDYYKKSEIDKMLENLNGLSSEKIENLIDTKINAALADFTGVYKYRGTKNTYEELPTDGNKNGDVWNVLSDGMNYAWSDNHWDALGSTINLDGYATEDWVKLQGYSKITDADVRGIVNDTINSKLKDYKTSSEISELYYNKNEIDAKLANIGTSGTIDLSNYYSKTEADENELFGKIGLIRGGGATSYGI